MRQFTLASCTVNDQPEMILTTPELVTSRWIHLTCSHLLAHVTPVRYIQYANNHVIHVTLKLHRQWDADISV